MRQALEKLEFFERMRGVSEDTARLIAALRERLAQNAARPCKIGGPCVPTENGPCACRELQQSPAPTTGNVLMDAYHAMQEKKQAARTTDRGPVAWLPPDPPPECKSEAEKTAFAFGWFKALEAQRLAQPEQEPVAWLQIRENEPPLVAPRGLGTPVYTAPRQWKGLTDEDREDILRWIEWKEVGSQPVAPQKLIAYVERKLREKNT